MKINKNSVFFSYLKSYFLISIIPLLVLGCALYFNAVVNLRSEIESANIEKLKQVRNMLDMRFSEFDNITARISEDPKLNLYLLKNQSYSQIEAVQELKKYKANSTMIDDVFLYFRGDDKIYSSAGSFLYSSFEKYLYVYEDFDKHQLLQRLNEAYSPVIYNASSTSFDSKQRNGIINILYPIPRNSSAPFATLLLVVRETMLTDMINNLLDTIKGGVYILDENRNVLAAKNNSIFEKYSDISDVITKYPAEGVYELLTGSGKYSLMHIRTDKFRWSFIVIVPIEQFFKKFDQTRAIVFGVLLLAVLLSAVSAFIMSRKSYTPVGKLLNHISKENERMSYSNNKQNEFEFIQHSYDEAIYEKQDLSVQVDLQKPYIRDQLIMTMLSGKLNEDEQLSKLLEKCNICFKDNFFAVIVLSTDVFCNANEDRETLVKRIEKINHAGITGYGVEKAQEKIIAIILNLSEDIEYKCRIRDLILGIIQDFGLDWEKPCAGIGTLYRDRSKILFSYIEAMEALENVLVKGNDNMLFFDEIKTVGSFGGNYPVEEQFRLIQALKQGDEIMAFEMMETIFSSFLHKDMSLLMVRYICYDLINSIVKLVKDIRLEGQTGLIEDLLCFNSITEFKLNTFKLVKSICESIQQHKESKNNSLKESILHYVNKNYMDSGISLEKIADEFGVTLAYLSRFFKNQTNSTFTDYLRTLRIEKAKSLLLTTNMNIKDIILSIGYFDLPSFTRTFRNMEGLTPGQFRSLYREYRQNR